MLNKFNFLFGIFALFFVVSLSALAEGASCPVNLADMKSISEWRKILEWSNECEEMRKNKNLKAVDLLYLYPLPVKNQYLVRISCGFGAYQGRDEYAYFDSIKFRGQPIHILDYNEETHKIELHKSFNGGHGNSGISYLSKNEKNNVRVENWYKSAGHGGCGTWGEYKLNLKKMILEPILVMAHEDCDHPQQYGRDGEKLYGKQVYPLVKSSKYSKSHKVKNFKN